MFSNTDLAAQLELQKQIREGLVEKGMSEEEADDAIATSYFLVYAGGVVLVLVGLIVLAILTLFGIVH